MHTIITNKNAKGTLFHKVAAKLQEVSQMFKEWQRSPVRSLYAVNENFPTIILTETRGKIHPHTSEGFHLHSSHDILEVKKPTWAEWREQMSHIKKAQRS